MVLHLSEPPQQIEQAPADVRLWSRQELEERIAAGIGGPFGVLWACDRYRDGYGSMRTPERLRRLLEDSQSPILVAALLERLKEMEADPSIGAAVAHGIDDREALGNDVLYEALAVLAAHGAAEHFEVFRRYLAHPDDAVRSIAVEGVVESGHPEAPEAILGGFSRLNEPVAAFFLLQGLFSLDDAGAAERAGRLVVERLTNGALESAYCLGVSLDPLRFGFYLHERAMNALYPELARPEEQLDEELADLLVLRSHPAAKRRGETIAPAGVRRRLGAIARGGEHRRLVEALLDLLRRAVGLIEEESSTFAARARVVLRFLVAAVESPGFARLGGDAHREFAIWAAGALAHVLRGRDPEREVEHAREDLSAALDLLATDVCLPPDVMVDILRRVPLEMIEELDEELDIDSEGTTASRQMMLAARLPQKWLPYEIEFDSRSEDFRRDQSVLAARVAGDQVLPIFARGLVAGDVELEDFLEAVRSLGTVRSRAYLRWSFGAVEELGPDAARALDAALACGDPELWRRALESFRRGRLHPDLELGRGDLLVRVAMLLGLLGLEEDPGAALESALGTRRRRRSGRPAAKSTLAVGEETDQPARPGEVDDLDPEKAAARGRFASPRTELRSDASAPPFATVRREGRKVGRNDPCPCGSGRKYKKCCGGRA